MGYIEGQNFVLEYRGTERADQLPALAAELVRRQVTLIVTTGNANAALAAKAATSTIPIVFVTSSDPVKIGLVDSLSRSGVNITGVTNFGGELVAKRLELLREHVPQATVIGFLTNPKNPLSEDDITEFGSAARRVGQPFIVLTATTPPRKINLRPSYSPRSWAGRPSPGPNGPAGHLHNAAFLSRKWQ